MEGANTIQNAQVCTEHGCPTLDRLTLRSCKAVGDKLQCDYESGYRDPTDDFTEVEDEVCAGICDIGSDGLIGCVSITDVGHACIIRGGCVGGRRFTGMPNFVRGGSTLAEALGELAHLEACSITAFELLAADLAHHSAPASLVRRCLAAARDEARHRASVLALARAHGFAGEAEVPASDPRRATPSLLGLAEENATEGCVRETWGAVTMEWLAELWPSEASTWRRIARDEARHAALAFIVDAWIDRSLSPDERKRVSEARARAIEELHRAPIDPLLALRGVGPDARTSVCGAVFAELYAEPSYARRTPRRDLRTAQTAC